MLVVCGAMAMGTPVGASSPLLLRTGPEQGRSSMDVYFSADVETDGPIPGRYSMLAVGVVVAGRFDGQTFSRPSSRASFYAELRPISDDFQVEALQVNKLDRERLVREGKRPEDAMRELGGWIHDQAAGGEPVLVAYPLSFDWTWLYWYFMAFTGASPFNHSRCFDIKTAYAVKAGLPIAGAGRAKLDPSLQPTRPHTHHALDDAMEQAEIFARLFEWQGPKGRERRGGDPR